MDDLDFFAVFLQENHVQASQMSHRLESYSGFLCITFPDEFCWSEWIHESLIRAQRVTLGHNPEDQILCCSNSPRLCHCLWPLGGHLDGLFLMAATSLHGHVRQSCAYLPSDLSPAFTL